MTKIPNLKTSAIIFVFLALIISLFPPYLFDNRIKQYDFLFNAYKKNINAENRDFSQKFYNKDTLEYYKDKWSDCKFNFVGVSIDSFFTQKRILYLRPKRNNRGIFEDIQFNLPGNYGDDFTGLTNNIIKVDKNETNENAINYYKVRKEYIKHPEKWEHKYVNVFDSMKRCENYKVIKPVYELMSRKILLSELLVEYVLASLISIIFGFIINKFHIIYHKNDMAAN